jgi:hypothetical protein
LQAPERKSELIDTLSWLVILLRRRYDAGPLSDFSRSLIMPITVTIDDELANRLKPYEDQLSKVLDLGIRELQARGEPGYAGLSSLLEKLAALPAPEEVLALRPSPPLQERLNALLEKNRAEGLTPDDQREWDNYEYVEHLVRLAKISAMRKLKDPGA